MLEEKKRIKTKYKLLQTKEKKKVKREKERITISLFEAEPDNDMNFSIENPCQDRLKEFFFGTTLGININSSSIEKPCERLLRTKQLDQTIKQLHKVENR